MPKDTRKRVVVIGGGTGTYQVLVGLKKHNLHISAIVTMSDSGGSTGKLRKELSILPPGDVRRALIALSNLPLDQAVLERLFDYRFETGKSLKGHSMGNLLLAALTQITGREDLAIKEAGRILAVSGYVYPVTLDKNDLCAVLENGKKIIGETNIDKRAEGAAYAKVPIREVYLKPKATIYTDAREAIEKADLIVLGPGDLYTSILPNLLVEGVPEAINKSKAKVVYIVNLMTKPGETDNFKASNFVNEVKRYLNGAADRLSHVFVNTKLSESLKTIEWYEQHAQEMVEDDLGRKKNGILVIRGNFTQKGELIRHSPEKLAKSIVKLL